MGESEVRNQIQSVKAKIEAFIEKGYLSDAKLLLEQLESHLPGDPELCSMKSIIYIMEGDLDRAEVVLLQGLKDDSLQYDLLYNLAYLFELRCQLQKAADLYAKAGSAAVSEEQKTNVALAIDKLKEMDAGITIQDKLKIVFFVKEGLDNFLTDIVNLLESEYWVRKIIVNDFSQIDSGMKWADICWFEWCDELIAYGSNQQLANEKVLLCRLHRYEVFTEPPRVVKWENVDRLIVVTDHLQLLLADSIPDIKKRVEIITICNGVDLNKYQFVKRSGGYHLAYVGYIHSRKNPSLLLQITQELVDIDRRYKLYIAGKFQEPMVELYWNYMVEQMGLKENVIFCGWQKNIDSWLEDKNYLLSTSIHESFGYGIAEAMARGLKPIIHNFPYAREIWPGQYLFNTVPEAVNMVLSDDYNSEEYLACIRDKYSLDLQIREIKNLIKALDRRDNKKVEALNISYGRNANTVFSPYDENYIDQFDFSTAGIAAGKKELIDEEKEVIEFILLNEKGKRLIITDLVFDYKNGVLYLPDYIGKSKNAAFIKQFFREIQSAQNQKMQYDSRGIAGFVYDRELLRDIQENMLAYQWERGIPATAFMSVSGFHAIIGRYQFAQNFLHNGGAVLDAATGFGYGAAYLSGKYPDTKIKALDIADENLRFGESAYSFNNIDWLLGDVAELPFEKEFFDAYLSFETLEHISLDRVDLYLSEAVRVLKKGGLFILSTPNRSARPDANNPFHIKEYVYEELELVLKRFFSNIESFSMINGEYKSNADAAASNFLVVCRKE